MIHKILFLAFRNLFRNSRRTILTVSVAAAGFAGMAIFAGYVDFTFYGLRELTIRNGFTGDGGTGHLQIVNARAEVTGEKVSMESGISDYRPLIDELEKCDNVFYAMPRISFGGIVSNGEQSLSFLGHGVDPGKEAQLISFFSKDKPIILDNSSYLKLQRNVNGVMLGKGLAQALNARVGDSLIIVSTTVEGAINAVDAEVVGFVATGVKMVDRYYLLMHFNAVQRLVQTGKVNRVVVVMKELSRYSQTVRSINTTLRKSPRLAGLKTVGWDDLAEYYHSIRDLYHVIFGFVGIVGVVIVVLSCTNTTLMAIMERVQEIGTLRAIGIADSWIGLIFLLEGFFTGLISVVVGIGFQYLVAVPVNHLRFQMPPAPGMTTPYHLLIFTDTPELPYIAVLIVVSTVLASGIALIRIRKISIAEALGHV